ncbi:hypothetical protein N7462_005895 [Penicillium macrosclerotiorum]|uniref:uncharacterized protein n=1 Tax=Penicillium macrosclerotiorum TaxID=303699 RepID=UPI0025480DD1|nr:uncharacterized protein N7462_005895 [Penicillium macrosclerotiorum]KAJ5682730.1 hypothetical protein N7462_005895 [Penicillium macrosclerotiorum]
MAHSLMVPEVISLIDSRLGWGLTFVGIVVAHVIIRRYASPIKNIPGPFWASFSSLWVVYQLWKGRIETEIFNLHKKHGIKVEPSNMSFDRLIIYVDPQRHKEMSRNVAAGYALSNIISSEPHVDAVMELFINHLNQHCDSSTPIELNRWFTFFAFDVVGEVTFSKSFGFIETGTDIRDAIANTRALALYISAMGHYTWLHNMTLVNPLISRLGIQPSSHVFDTCLVAINGRKENPEVRKDMMQQWLETRAKYPDRMKENEIFSAAVANVGAGSDTVSATMQALFYWLIRSPQHLHRLREELDAAQTRGELSPIVQYNEAQKLTFLQACIKETYRFQPGVPSCLPRVVPQGGMTIGGTYFAEGVILSVNPWIFHRNPALFGEDCDTFNPDRWLQGNTKDMDSFLIHWGSGYRQCPGRNLAHFEIGKLAATLIRDFEFEQVDPKKEWEWANHFTINPWGWPCNIRRRSSAC